jgi:hypothetical protein
VEKNWSRRLFIVLVEVWKSKRKDCRVIFYIFKKDDKILGGRIYHLKGNKKLIPKYRTFMVNNFDYFSVPNPSPNDNSFWVFVREERFKINS